MKQHKLTVLAGALILGLSGSAFAGDEGKKATEQMEVDTGVTTETTESVETTHGDTVSSFAREQAEERQEMMPPPDSPPGSAISQVAHGQRDWTRLDTDGDGTLTDAEIQADVDLVADLDTYDTDGDGMLTRAEFDAYVEGNATADVDVDVEDDEFD